MIDLQAITPDNHAAARELSVHPHQTRWVATIDKSLADAYVYKDALFRIAFKDNVPIGYVLIYPFDKEERRVVNIVRLMIDAGLQGKGLGRALLNQTMSWISTLAPPVDTVRISTLPDNEAALSLYRSAGFQEQGTEDGEIALYRNADGEKPR